MVIDRESALRKARENLKEALKEKDFIIINAVNTTEDLIKIINMMFERLEEWNKLFYPEFKAKSIELYCTSILEGGLPNNIIEITKEDKRQLINIAKEILEVIKLKNNLEQYTNEVTKNIAPNVSYLIGPELTAKLIASVGGLKKLGVVPASTVQVLGAEKALFKHLKTGSKPPKHGLIFQFAAVGKAPKKKRGKIARTVASKIVIAARADSFTKNFIAEKLKEDMEIKINKILRS
ncbi:MAG: NOP5/NOP56 family protein [Candidatus Micrarchaeia archaeon]|jgi:nucleolar protein 56